MPANWLSVPVDVISIVDAPPESWWNGVETHLAEDLPVVPELLRAEIELRTAASRLRFRYLLTVTCVLRLGRNRLRIDGVLVDMEVTGFYNTRTKKGELRPVYEFR